MQTMVVECSGEEVLVTKLEWILIIYLELATLLIKIQLSSILTLHVSNRRTNTMLTQASSLN